MTIRRRSLIQLLTLATIASLMPLAGASADPSKSALPQVTETINQVVDIATRLAGDAKSAERRSELRLTVDKTFDFREMARRSLGAQWDKISSQEQNDFVNVFSDLLARTYLNRVETVRRDMVSIQGEKLDFPRSIVRTIVNNKGDKFPIDYKLAYTGSSWRVYDVVIENIGLVANYRNEFAGIIRKEQFAGLMTRLREKNQGT